MSATDDSARALFASAGNEPSHEELVRLFNVSLDMLCVANKQGYFVYINPVWTRELGWSREELLARPFIEFVHPGDLEATISEWRSVSGGRDTIFFRNRYQHKDGHWCWLEWLAHVVGPEQQVYAAARNITPRRMAEEHAQELRNSLAHVERVASMGELATGIAHELNQPLSAIQTHAETCERSLSHLDVGPDALEDLRQIRALTARAAGIIRRLRAFVARREPVPTDVSVRSSVEDILVVLGRKIQQSNVTVEVDLPEDAQPIRADALEFQQVVLNLVSNAIDAVESNPPEERRVEIQGRSATSGTFELSVTDNGPGLAPELIEKMFDPFFTTKPSGLGIGLSLSRSLIESHGGSLTGFPRLSGSGMRFRVLIPTA